MSGAKKTEPTTQPEQFSIRLHPSLLQIAISPSVDLHQGKNSIKPQTIRQEIITLQHLNHLRVL